MNKKNIILTTAALVLGIFLFNSNAVEAYKGDPNVKGSNYSQERHEAMEKAFENKDYEAWKKLMQGKGRVIQVVNKNNFAKFAQAHELAEKGKLEEAKKIRQELGLGLQNGSGNKTGQGRNWSK